MRRILNYLLRTFLVAIESADQPRAARDSQGLADVRSRGRCAGSGLSTTLASKETCVVLPLHRATSCIILPAGAYRLLRVDRTPEQNRTAWNRSGTAKWQAATRVRGVQQPRRE